MQPAEFNDVAGHAINTAQDMVHNVIVNIENHPRNEPYCPQQMLAILKHLKDLLSKAIPDE